MHTRTHKYLRRQTDTLHIRVRRYHKNGDDMALKYHGITKYHDIVIIMKFNYYIYPFKLLLHLSALKFS